MALASGKWHFRCGVGWWRSSVVTRKVLQRELIWRECVFFFLAQLSVRFSVEVAILVMKMAMASGKWHFLMRYAGGAGNASVCAEFSCADKVLSDCDFEVVLAVLAEGFRVLAKCWQMTTFRGGVGKMLIDATDSSRWQLENCLLMLIFTTVLVQLMSDGEFGGMVARSWQMVDFPCAAWWWADLEGVGKCAGKWRFWGELASFCKWHVGKMLTGCEFVGRFIQAACWVIVFYEPNAVSCLMSKLLGTDQAVPTQCLFKTDVLNHWYAVMYGA
jgi:hypothetical protein